MVASTWLGDHQGRPSAPTNSLQKLHMARYKVLLTYLYLSTNKTRNNNNYNTHNNEIKLNIIRTQVPLSTPSILAQRKKFRLKSCFLTGNLSL